MPTLLSAIFLQDEDYDDFTKVRRFRRNNLKHKYPSSRKEGKPKSGGTKSMEMLEQQLKRMNKELAKLQDKIEEQRHDTESDNSQSSGSNTNVVARGKSVDLVAPISLRALMAKNKVSTKKKKPKPNDANWSSDSCSSPKKKRPAKHQKNQKYYSSSSSAEETSDESDVRPAKKKFTGTKKTVKQMRKERAAGQAKTTHDINAFDDDDVDQPILLTESQIFADSGNTSKSLKTSKPSTVANKVTESYSNMVIPESPIRAVVQSTGPVNASTDMTTRDSSAASRSKVSRNNASEAKKVCKESKQTAKPSTTKTRWIIVANKGKPTTNQLKKLIKQIPCESMDVVNHRRHEGFKGELLVVYTDGQRHWCLLHGAYIDIPDRVKDYMSANNLSLDDMGYSVDDPDLKETDAAIGDTNTTDNLTNNITTDELSNTITETETMDDGEQTNVCDEPGDDTAPDPTGTTLGIAGKITDMMANEDGASNLMESSLPNDKQEIPSTVSEDTDLACCHDHSKVNNFIAEYNSLYCTNGNDFDGVHCANKECNILFVHKIAGVFEDCLRPTARRLLYSCPNSAVRCPYALCFACYYNAINANKRPKY
jgi:hypothetical protein